MLEKVKGLSAEEVWAVLPGGGFRNQYEGNWRILHPEHKLVGRAVTAVFMPLRPDVAEIMEAEAKAKGLRDNGNQVSAVRPDFYSLPIVSFFVPARSHCSVSSADPVLRAPPCPQPNQDGPS